MKQLLILSGKGGTGKTTVASAFIELGKGRTFADCDVDAPNLHLVISQTSKPIKTDYYGFGKALIDQEKCIRCGLCEENCTFRAIKDFSVGIYEARGIFLPLYEMNCRFKSPARYENEVLVKTCLNTLSRVRIGFSYQVLNAETNKLIATGETLHAWTDKTLKPVNAERKFPDVYSVLSEIYENF